LKPDESNSCIDLDFKSIFELDNSIRFVGICSTDGRLFDAHYRDGIKPLITNSILQQSAMKTAIRSITRKEEEGLMGPPVYSVTAYHNVKRITIPINGDLLLLVSLDKNTQENPVIVKILDVLKSFNLL